MGDMKGETRKILKGRSGQLYQKLLKRDKHEEERLLQQQGLWDDSAVGCGQKPQLRKMKGEWKLGKQNL